MSSPRFAHVALPLPLATPYTYAIPEILADRIVPGARVVVPVRRRELVGIVVGIDDAAPEMTAKEVLVAPDLEPALPGPLLKTAEWVAGYYGAPIGTTLKAMLPASLWGESEVFLSLRRGARVGGGTAGALAEWLERRGGGRRSGWRSGRSRSRSGPSPTDSSGSTPSRSRSNRPPPMGTELRPGSSNWWLASICSSGTSALPGNPNSAPSTKPWNRPRARLDWIRSGTGSKSAPASLTGWLPGVWPVWLTWSDIEIRLPTTRFRFRRRHSPGPSGRRSVPSRRSPPAMGRWCSGSPAAGRRWSISRRFAGRLNRVMAPSSWCRKSA